MNHDPLNTIRRKLAEAPNEWLMPPGVAPVAVAWGMSSTPGNCQCSSPVRAPNSHVVQALSISVATLEAIDRGAGPAKV
jgi:hypothetical protein